MIVPAPNRKSSGFTLIELMLALAVAVVLLGLIFSLYLTLSRAVDDQHARRAGGAAMIHALDRLTRDLTSALPVPGHDEGGFMLETQDAARGPSSRITFCTTRPTGFRNESEQDASAEREVSGMERDGRWFDVVEVAYWLDYTPRERGRLIRTERPLLGPDALEPARTNVLVTGVDGFHVRVRRKDEWVDAWELDLEDEDAGWPSAARITIEPDDQAKGARPYNQDVLIPTGWVIEPDRTDE